MRDFKRVLATAFLASLALIPVLAAAGAYDGSYYMSYSYQDPYDGRQRTLDMPSGSFHVINGSVSIGAWGSGIGEVDQWGGVEFRAPCPQASQVRALWTGAILDDGSGRGQFVCDNKRGGTWTLAQVSGAGFDLESISFYQVASLAGVAAGLAAVGLAFVPIGPGAGASAVIGSFWQGPPTIETAPPPTGVWGTSAPSYSQPSVPPRLSTDAPPTTDVSGQPLPPIGFEGGVSLDTGRYINPQPEKPPEAVPTGVTEPLLPPISMDQGQPLGGVGASVAPPDFGPLQGLNAVWDSGSVTLTWQPPVLNSGTDVLLGYQVSVVQYGPASTMPVSQVITNLPPGATTLTQPFVQTSRWSTGGDIVGFRVDPIFHKVANLTGAPFVAQAGGLLVRVGQVLGTPGL